MIAREFEYSLLYHNYYMELLAYIPVNIFDVVLVVFFVLFIVGEASFGFQISFLHVLPIILSFFVGVFIYPPLSQHLLSAFFLSKPLSDFFGYALSGVFLFTIFEVLAIYFRQKKEKSLRYPTLGGVFSATIAFSIIASFFLMILLCLPLAAIVKEQMRGSFFANELILLHYRMESSIRKIIAVSSSSVNISVVSSPRQTLILHDATHDYVLDTNAEKKLEELINKKRDEKKAPRFKVDTELSTVAENHAIHMATEGYLSHVSPGGISLFDRLASADIVYSHAGESIAYTQSVPLAFAGFMESDVDRKNIESLTLKRMGIGVADAGNNGKIVVILFAD